MQSIFFAIKQLEISNFRVHIVLQWGVIYFHLTVKFQQCLINELHCSIKLCRTSVSRIKAEVAKAQFIWTLRKGTAQYDGNVNWLNEQ